MLKNSRNSWVKRIDQLLVNSYGNICSLFVIASDTNLRRKFELYYVIMCHVCFPYTNMKRSRYIFLSLFCGKISCNVFLFFVIHLFVISGLWGVYMCNQRLIFYLCVYGYHKFSSFSSAFGPPCSVGVRLISEINFEKYFHPTRIMIDNYSTPVQIRLKFIFSYFLQICSRFLKISTRNFNNK